MDMTLDDSYELERNRQPGQRRLDLAEQHERLELFTNPQDAYEEVDPEDAHLDLQIRNFRGLAKRNSYSALF